MVKSWMGLSGASPGMRQALSTLAGMAGGRMLPFSPDPSHRDFDGPHRAALAVRAPDYSSHNHPDSLAIASRTKTIKCKNPLLSPTHTIIPRSCKGSETQLHE